jgi:hypothetical protein
MPLDTPLHQEFYASLHKARKHFDINRDYRPRLMSYRRRLQEAQRFVLTDSAVWEIVERADLDLGDLMDRVQLAMLPFNEVWIEYNQHEKVSANYAAGRGPEEDLDGVPERVGFLMRRAGGPNQWIATRVTSWDGADLHGVHRFVRDSHGLSMFDYVFDAESTEPIIELGGQKSFVNDLPKQLRSTNLDPVAVARGLWGAQFKTEDDPLEEADKKATIAFNPLWRDWYHDNLEKRGGAQRIADILVEEFMQLRGEMRFLVVALAIMNEVPILLSDEHKSEKTFYAKGRNQPFLTHRTVEINIPAITLKKKTVADYLNIAAAKKRRHMVRGHMRRYRDRTGRVVKEKWIEAHARGSAELGWVNHDYEVKKAENIG